LLSRAHDALRGGEHFPQQDERAEHKTQGFKEGSDYKSHGVT